jgi:predicted MPP superfamily phosphohydrolase
LAWGSFIEPHRVGLSRIWLIGGPLPSDVQPLRLLHISDLHVERFGRREEQLLHMVRAINPDLILLTGDYVNLTYVDDPIALSDARRVLAALSTDRGTRATGGVFAVLGSPPVDRNSAPLFNGLDIRVLRDEVVTIDLSIATDGRRQRGDRPDGRLALVGLDCSHNSERDSERLAAVFGQVPSDAFRVLLYHSPELIPVAHKFGVDLYLCGHTHGGQVRLPFYGALLTSSELGKQFEMGYYQLENTHVYVSRGIGLEGLGAPRVRFLCPPEMTLFSVQGQGAEDGTAVDHHHPNQKDS